MKCVSKPERKRRRVCLCWSDSDLGTTLLSCRLRRKQQSKCDIQRTLQAMMAAVGGGVHSTLKIVHLTPNINIFQMCLIAIPPPRCLGWIQSLQARKRNVSTEPHSTPPQQVLHVRTDNMRTRRSSTDRCHTTRSINAQRDAPPSSPRHHHLLLPRPIFYFAVIVCVKRFQHDCGRGSAAAPPRGEPLSSRNRGRADERYIYFCNFAHAVIVLTPQEAIPRRIKGGGLARLHVSVTVTSASTALVSELLAKGPSPHATRYDVREV